MYTQNSIIYDKIANTVVSYPKVINSAHTESIDQKFDRLTEEWTTSTISYSSLDDIVNNDSYQEIIKMGHRAIRLILDDLQKSPKHWFYALRAITGVNPIKQSASGDVRKMTDAWVKWGRKEGYLG
jgi:hypothetical protein